MVRLTAVIVLTGVRLYNYPTLQGSVAILTILVYALAVVHYKPYQEGWMVRLGLTNHSLPRPSSLPYHTPRTASRLPPLCHNRLALRWVYLLMRCYLSTLASYLILTQMTSYATCQSTFFLFNKMLELIKCAL